MKQNVNKDIRVDPPIESARIKLTTKQLKTTRKQNDSKHLSYDNIDSWNNHDTLSTIG